MIEILLYLIKSILAGVIFFGFYHLSMRHESFLAFNRYYLLLSSLLIVILPFFGSLIPVDLLSLGRHTALPVITLPEVVITGGRIVSPEQEKAFLNWAGLGYMAITAAMLAGLLLSILRIIRFYRSTYHAEKLEDNIYLVSECGSPYSFLGRIFISRQYTQHPGLKSILIHENAHIRQKHLLDLFLLEFLSSIFWFNPFFFLIKRAMSEVHEFLADREVIRLGTEPLMYQKLLYNEVSGNPQYIVANNFNLLTKKRIAMLIKKSGKMAAFRIGMLIPCLLAAAIVIALVHSNSVMAQNQLSPQKPKQSATVNPASVNTSEKSYLKEVPEKAKDESGKEVYIIVDEVPQFPGGDEARTLYIVNSVKYPPDAKKKGIQGTVFVNFIVEEDGSITNVKLLRGIGGDCDEEALRVIREMPKWIPGKSHGKSVRVQFSIPIKFVLNK